ncbi:GSCOCT00013846001.3-RA-CDS, partial [Cotesia congregata]
MDSTLHSLLGINRFLLERLGQWPHQSELNKICSFISAVFFLFTQVLFQVFYKFFRITGGMIAASCDMPVFLESIPPVLVSFVCLIKFTNFIINAEKMKKLLNTMDYDWKTINDPEEKRILHFWATRSRKYSAVCGSMVPFMLSPVVPMIIRLFPEELISPNNSIALIRPLMFRVDYFLNIDKYYHLIVFHSIFGTLAYITVAAGIDSMFLVYVQHACAMFHIIGFPHRHRVSHLSDDDNIDIDFKPHILNDKPYQQMVKCIIEHSKTLEFSQTIESANTMSFFLQLGMNMITISFTGFQVVSTLDEPGIAFRNAGFSITQTSILFFVSWPSQRLADESVKACLATTRAAWYLTSSKTRQLLQLFIMRSAVPCQLTAGKFYLLNMQNFSAVVKTSVSYMMILLSTQ